MSNFPSGTFAFLFTDIEESTRMARVNPETWKSLGSRHHQILREVIESKKVLSFRGDAFCAAFHIAAMLLSQRMAHSKRYRLFR